jgi:hypothetical protein
MSAADDGKQNQSRADVQYRRSGERHTTPQMTRAMRLHYLIGFQVG